MSDEKTSKSGKPESGANDERPGKDAGGVTQAERAYRQLRRLVMSGRFAPGESLPIRVLSEVVGTGLSPTREAVQRLCVEGGFEMTPNRTVRAPMLTLAEFDAIYETRILVEGHAAAMAAARGTRREHQAAAHALNRLLAACDAGDATAVLLANMEFHFTIYRASRMPHLVEFIERLWLRTGPLLLVALRSGKVDRSNLFRGTEEKHFRLLASLRARRSDEARQILESLIIDDPQEFGIDAGSNTAFDDPA